MKKCTKCGQTKTLESFSKCKDHLYGRMSKCKKCQVIDNKKYKAYFLKYNRKYHKIDYEKKKQYGISIRAIQYYGLRKALAIYDKANRQCSICSSEEFLCIHHIDHNGSNNQKKGLPVNNNIDNLQVLCRVCHGRLHGKQNKGRKKAR